MKLGILINFVITVGIPLLLETIILDIQIILEVIPKDIEIYKRESVFLHSIILSMLNF